MSTTVPIGKEEAAPNENRRIENCNGASPLEATGLWDISFISGYRLGACLGCRPRGVGDSAGPMKKVTAVTPNDDDPWLGQGPSIDMLISRRKTATYDLIELVLVGAHCVTGDFRCQRFGVTIHPGADSRERDG